MTWEQFFDWLMGWEGRVVHNDPRDPGGQTAWGISRRYWPKWAGWGLVDSAQILDHRFESLVSDFYIAQYADLWKSIPSRANAVAVDTAINMGHVYAVQCLQDAMNRLAGSKYVDVDGQFGPQTKAAIKTVDPSALAFTMAAIRMAEYNRRSRKDKAKAVFLSGWINRVSDLMGAI